MWLTWSIPVAKRLDLANDVGAGLREVTFKRADKAHDLLAPRLLNKMVAPRLGLLREELFDAADGLDLHFLNRVRDEASGHVHAVERVADVVEHAGCDFRDSGKAGDFYQLTLGFTKALVALHEACGRPHPVKQAREQPGEDCELIAETASAVADEIP